jgi:hypothetical protein
MTIENTGAPESAPEDTTDHYAGAADILREIRASAAESPAEGGEQAAQGDPAPAGQAPAGETPPQPKPGEAPAEVAPAAAPSWLDAERELQAKIEAKRAEQAQQKTQAQQSEAEARAAQREQEFQAKIAEFERDPVAYYAKHGHDPRPAFKRFAEIAAKGPAVKVEDTVESLRAELAELKAQVANPKPPAEVEEIRQWQQAQARQRDESAFVEHASDAKTYPLLSRLPAQSRVELAHRHAARYRAAGIEFDLATIARHAEGELRHQFELLGGTLSSASPAAKTPTSSDGAARAPSSGPTAITNATASDVSGASRELTDEERWELAAQELRRANSAAAVSAQ